MSTRYDGTSRFCTISGPPIENLVRVDDPTPDTPVRAIDTSSLVEPKSGSGASRVAIFAVPENDTLSGVPLTMPLTDTRLVFQGFITGDGAIMAESSEVEVDVDAASCAGACATQSVPPAARATAARTPPFNNARRFFMASSRSEERRVGKECRS